MDLESARSNMIEQQIRPWNVLAVATLEALATVRREAFVPPDYRDLAFADIQIPLGDGEVMLEPKVSARMVESLALGDADRVLEIGTGSGYVTALLATLCGQVVSVEINEKLRDMARQNLADTGVKNIELQLGDAHAGWNNSATFDAIFIGGSLPEIADVNDEENAWLNALKDGGRLVGIEGDLPAMTVVLLHKTAAGVTRETLFETVAPRLRNVKEAAQFVF